MRKDHPLCRQEKVNYRNAIDIQAKCNRASVLIIIKAIFEYLRFYALYTKILPKVKIFNEALHNHETCRHFENQRTFSCTNIRTLTVSQKVEKGHGLQKDIYII